jgi:hypothetical protein
MCKALSLIPSTAKRKRSTDGVAQGVEFLPSKHEAFSLNPRTTKKRENTVKILRQRNINSLCKYIS